MSLKGSLFSGQAEHWVQVYLGKCPNLRTVLPQLDATGSVIDRGLTWPCAAVAKVNPTMGS